MFPPPGSSPRIAGKAVVAEQGPVRASHLRKFGIGVLIAFTVKGLATTGLIAFVAAKSLGFF